MTLINYDDFEIGRSTFYGHRLLSKSLLEETLFPEQKQQLIFNPYNTARLTFELRCGHDIVIITMIDSKRQMDPDSIYNVIQGFRCNSCPITPGRPFSGVVRVWRLWKQRGGDLYPLISGKYGHWQPNDKGVIESHDIPTRGRAQGFYGFYSLETLYLQEARRVEIAMGGESCNSLGLTNAIWSMANAAAGDQTYMKDYTMVLGSFLAYGRLIKAKLGVRAQFAKPEFLMLPDQNQDYALELMTLADKYGMKPVTREQAEEMESGFLEGKGLDG